MLLYRLIMEESNHEHLGNQEELLEEEKLLEEVEDFINILNNSV